MNNYRSNSYVVALCFIVSFNHLQALDIRSPELSVLFENDSRIWQLSAEKFMEIESDNGFVWDSAQGKKSARSTKEELRFLGIQIIEANAYFDEIGFSKLNLSIYNRGDMGWVEEKDFENYLDSIRKRISEWSKNSPKLLKPKRRTSKIKLKRMGWSRNNTQVYLEWSSTKKHKQNGVTIPFRTEFIRIRIRPAPVKGTARARKGRGGDPNKKPISYSRAKSKVKRNEKGDIFLKDVPMVNQGDKGYCAVASISRIMRYYGKEIDQHEVAQMVETTYLGTDPELMVNLLKKASFKLGVRIRTHQDFKFEDLFDFVDDYNKLARRQRKQELKVYKNVPLIYYYQHMDPKLLARMKTRKTADINRFVRDIERHINVGIPLAWSVILGIIEENPPLPQAIGGHMRVIIGYNPREKVIIYTDSWGRGHEYKYMTIKEAITITIGLYTIEPRSRRT